jgi:predicted dienelactone hydrolase
MVLSARQRERGSENAEGLLPANQTMGMAHQDLYKGEPGPLPVHSEPEVRLRDAARGKELLLRVSWPGSQGPFPLLLWSHGLFSSKDSYLPLVEHWVSHGYVCIQPTHSDSLTLQRSRVEALRRGDISDWPNRPRDLSFVLDSLEEIERRVPALVGTIDRSRVAASGHSHGAHTAQLAAGVVPFDPEGRPQRFHDPRVRALLMVSSEGRGSLLQPGSWKELAVPMMLISGSEDHSQFFKQPAEWRKDPFLLAPPGDRYLVWIGGAHHGFGGIVGATLLPGFGPPNPEHLTWVKAASTAFLDAHVGDDPAAKAYLQGSGLQEATEGAVTLTLR